MLEEAGAAFVVADELLEGQLVVFHGLDQLLELGEGLLEGLG